MNRTVGLQDRRMQKFRDALSRWERREHSALEACEIPGCSEQQSRAGRQTFGQPAQIPALDQRHSGCRFGHPEEAKSSTMIIQRNEGSEAASAPPCYLPRYVA